MRFFRKEKNLIQKNQWYRDIFQSVVITGACVMGQNP